MCSVPTTNSDSGVRTYQGDFLGHVLTVFFRPDKISFPIPRRQLLNLKEELLHFMGFSSRANSDDRVLLGLDGLLI